MRARTMSQLQGHARRILLHLLTGAMLATVVGSPARAEDALTPYRPLRYDDDFTYLRDPARHDDSWDPIKFVPLGDPDTYVSLGGELRERLDHFSQPAFGLAHGRASLDDLLHRLLLHGDLHLGPDVRVFLQLGNHAAAGKGNLTGPTDVDRLDVQQAFLDLSAHPGPGELTVRLGRQEMAFGSQRLVSVREPPNVRRSFDDVRAFWVQGDVRIDAFATRPVKDKAGWFDDEPDPQQSFWGAYATAKLSGVPGVSFRRRLHW